MRQRRQVCVSADTTDNFPAEGERTVVDDHRPELADVRRELLPRLRRDLGRVVAADQQPRNRTGARGGGRLVLPQPQMKRLDDLLQAQQRVVGNVG